MANEVQQYYYAQIKKPDHNGHDVDNFRLNLLPDYFQKELKFGIEQQARLSSETAENRSDCTISYIRSGNAKVLVLVGGKGEPKEHDDQCAAAWSHALGQLTANLKLVRIGAPLHPGQMLFGAVNIGTHTRFCQLEPDTLACEDYPGTPGRPLELAEDEAEIHRVLSDLVHRTLH